jgi:hypothetical protein
MLLPKPNTLREHIIHILAVKPALQASDLLKLLGLKGLRITKQGLYKELRTLIENSVVVKHQQTYSISIPWIINFSQFADNMFDNYIGQSRMTAFLPVEKKRARWSFHSLTMLNDFWVELIFCAVNESPKSEIYQWVPHPWWLLLQSRRSQTFDQGMLNTQKVTRTIVGSQTKLDLAYVQNQSVVNPREVVSFSHGPFHEQSGVYLDLIGDYLITVTLHPAVVSMVDQCYLQGHTSYEGKWASDFAACLRAARHKSHIEIERATSRVKKVKDLFLEYWG